MARAVGNRSWKDAFEDDKVRTVAEQQCKRTSSAIEELKDLDIDEIRISGGLSSNADMNQIRADVFGMPVSTVEGEETGLQGLAIIACCCMNNGDIAETARRTVKIKETFYPSANRYTT